MGLFLQTAIIKDTQVEPVKQALAAMSAGENEFELRVEECLFDQQGRDVVVFFNNECSGYEQLAAVMAKGMQAVVMLLYIFDEDFWGYFLCDGGREMDAFMPIADYFDDQLPKSEHVKMSGNPQILCRYFAVREEDVSPYLVDWTADWSVTDGAFPDDEFGREAWQLVDFMKRLGYRYTGGDDV